MHNLSRLQFTKYFARFFIDQKIFSGPFIHYLTAVRQEVNGLSLETSEVVQELELAIKVKSTQISGTQAIRTQL